MFNSPTKMLFLFTLILSTLICISSNSWLGAWIGLEMNLLSFIPLMNNNKNSISNEASLKYFMTQALASIMLLFFICLNFINLNYFSMLFFSNFYLMVINSTLLLKLGAAPFHFWFPSVMESLNWINNLILMTWQKINPFICISYCLNYNYIIMISLLSIIIGSLGGFNSTSIRKMMAFSSVSHIGWLLMSLMSSESNYWFYFLFYCIICISLTLSLNLLKLFYLNQILSNSISSLMKFSIMMTFLSMGGLPPFLGFIPKWIIIESMINNNMFLYILIMVILTLITLYFYLRMTFSILILNNFQMYWNFKLKKNLPFIFIWNYFSMLFFPLLFFLFMT
uniref:NADH-ubiquinone oxidoreductase chain 2 n=1 Tax=Hystrichopsylla weida qinlingensis TaxID=2583743 RepID=A0A4P9JLF6_9NEOP|nr:NADH dehydrogenase subunit 2 [Hystrichopsylla weida qinlingensis]QCU82648.1 NADH dehydrogenase subunit 2 [Hystrichopsylla weida qinlingensis]